MLVPVQLLHPPALQSSIPEAIKADVTGKWTDGWTGGRWWKKQEGREGKRKKSITSVLRLS